LAVFDGWDRKRLLWVGFGLVIAALIRIALSRYVGTICFAIFVYRLSRASPRDLIPRYFTQASSHSKIWWDSLSDVYTKVVHNGFRHVRVGDHAGHVQAVLISTEPAKAKGDMAFTPPVVCPICRQTLELDRTLEGHLVRTHTHQEIASYLVSLHEQAELVPVSD